MKSSNALSAIQTSPFRWAGSKRKLLPYLLRCVPVQYNRYIEPFAGSACLFFALSPKSAILGDFNPELIKTYDALREFPREIAERVHLMPQTHSFYYDLRSQPAATLNTIERAARFMYLNRFCFNGVYRTNRQGHFNVPRGVRTGRIPPKAAFEQWAAALSGVRLISGDFSRSVARVRRGDFVYLDPPYTKDGSRYSGEYGYGSFAEQDLTRAATWLDHIEKRGATFLLSYRHAPDVVRQFSKWHVRLVTVRRHVAGFLENRGSVKEMLVSNRAIPRA